MADESYGDVDFQFVHFNRRGVEQPARRTAPDWLNRLSNPEFNFPPVAENGSSEQEFDFPRQGIFLRTGEYPLETFALAKNVYAYTSRRPTDGIVINRDEITLPGSLLPLCMRASFDAGQISACQWLPLQIQADPEVVGMICVHADTAYQSSFGVIARRHQDQDHQTHLSFSPVAFDAQRIHADEPPVHGDEVFGRETMSLLRASDPGSKSRDWEKFLEKSSISPAVRLHAETEPAELTLNGFKEHGISKIGAGKNESGSDILFTTTSGKEFSVHFH